jgi:hypothetical protein
MRLGGFEAGAGKRALPELHATVDKEPDGAALRRRAVMEETAGRAAAQDRVAEGVASREIPGWGRCGA